jgi:hypothetical protein
MAKRERGQIIETATEARQAEPGRSARDGFDSQTVRPTHGMPMGDSETAAGGFSLSLRFSDSLIASEPSTPARKNRSRLLRGERMYQVLH